MSDSDQLNPDRQPTEETTTGSGAPAPSDRNSLTLGANGPLLLHDVHFIEQMAHFNREKVPERQPHAKGSVRSACLRRPRMFLHTPRPRCSSRAPALTC